MDGDEIRRRRKARGLTQTALAVLAGTTKQTVNRIEKGETLRSRFARKIKQLLDMPLADDEIETVTPVDLRKLKFHGELHHDEPDRLVLVVSRPDGLRLEHEADAEGLQNLIDLLERLKASLLPRK